MSTLTGQKFLLPAGSSLVEGLLPQPLAPSFDFDIPIALRKGKQSCTYHPIFHFVSYDRINYFFVSFVMSLSSVSIPRSNEEKILVPASKANYG